MRFLTEQNVTKISGTCGATWCQFNQHVYASLFHTKDKKLFDYEKKFHHACSYKNCADCAIRKSHLAVLVVHFKLAISCAQKSFKKSTYKNVDEMDPWWQKLEAD